MSRYKDFMNMAARRTNILRELTEDESKQLKNTLLKITLDIIEVCTEHDICVMLGGGSVLGAVRHNGFIPWDDDIDLLMPRDDYERFKKIFELELGDKYILNSPNYRMPAYSRFPKVEKKGTKLLLLEKQEHRIAVDIFIIENVPSNKAKRTIKGYLSLLISAIAAQVNFKENINDVEKSYFAYSPNGQLLFQLKVIAGTIFSFLSSAKWFDLLDRLNQYSRYEGIVTIPTGRGHYFGEMHFNNVFLPASQHVFEGIMMPIPGDSDAYLRKLYGNYRVIPEEEKRERHFIREICF